jgi:hypothetical protein
MSELDMAKIKMQEHAVVANAMDLPVIAYEFGQHLTTLGQYSETTDILLAANRDPRMYDAYMEHLGNWQEIFGDESMIYHWADVGNVASPSTSRFGSWGLEEYPTQFETEGLDAVPKLAALMQWM